MITDEQLQQQNEIENDNNWLGTFAETCSCTPCRECKGTGSVFISFDGQYIGSHRWDDMDEMITCEECHGSGIETICDYCRELEEAEAE